VDWGGYDAGAGEDWSVTTDYEATGEKQGITDNCFNDEQFLRMQGKRNRGEQIHFKDVQGGEAPSVLELTKGITQEVDMPVSQNNKDGPTSQQRRKHQITYLAHQAKEREFQLKNQWAENKFAKRQAQSKYGF